MNLLNKKGAWRFLLLGLLLWFVQQNARADLWAYVDERGVTHFAEHRIPPKRPCVDLPYFSHGRRP